MIINYLILVIACFILTLNNIKTYIRVLWILNLVLSIIAIIKGI